MFILSFKLVPDVLIISSWSIKFRKFELVCPYLIIFIGLTNSKLRNLWDQLQTFNNLRDQLEIFET
jgi:hypothetical protein